MRKNNLLPLITLFILLGAGLNLQAQAFAKEAAKYGEGGSYEYDVEKNGFIVDEFYDSEGTLREEVIHGVKVEGMELPGVQRKYYDCKGNLIYTATTVSIKSGGVVIAEPKPEVKETVYYDERIVYKDGKVVRAQRTASTTDWDFHQELKGDPPVWTDVIYVPGPKSFFEIQAPEPTSPEECEDGECDPVSQLFGGYSFLAAFSDGETETMPLGAHLAYTYLMTKRFGLVADASIHTKKEGEFRIMRAFLMGGIQYHLMKEREKRFVLPMLRLMAGAAFDKQKYPGSSSDATGLVVAAGLGFHFQINRVLAVKLLTDYLRVKFKEQEAQNNVRISAGINFTINCKYKNKL